MKSLFAIETIVLAWMILFMYSNVPGKLEGTFFPVTTNMRVALTDTHENRANVYLSFDKIRRCSFESVDFYLTNSQGTIKAEKTLVEKEVIRGLGEHYAGPWEIKISSSEIEKITVSTVHKCFNPWTVETKYENLTITKLE